jgi:hypothetical protein
MVGLAIDFGPGSFGASFSLDPPNDPSGSMNFYPQFNISGGPIGIGVGVTAEVGYGILITF